MPTTHITTLHSLPLQALDRLWNAGLSGTRAARSEGRLEPPPRFRPPRILLSLPGLCFGFMLVSLKGYIPVTLALTPSFSDSGEHEYLWRNIHSLIAALFFVFWLFEG